MAIAINSSDHIIGGGYFWNSPSAAATATVLQKSGNTSFGVLGLSDADVVVGWEQTSSSQVNAVYWSSPTAKPANLTLPFGDIGEATGISLGGAITGYGKDSITTNSTHALYWPSPTGTGVDLGVLPGVVGSNIPGSEGLSVNNSGVVVGDSTCSGCSTSSSGRHAFVWQGSGGMQDLNSISDAANKSLVLTKGTAINNNGYIVGTAVSTTDNSTHAFLAIPNGI
jgi:probable HAF family extracellular repeat protein